MSTARVKTGCTAIFICSHFNGKHFTYAGEVCTVALNAHSDYAKDLYTRTLDNGAIEIGIMQKHHTEDWARTS